MRNLRLTLGMIMILLSFSFPRNLSGFDDAQTKLMQQLTTWIEQGGDLDELVGELSEQAINTENEAAAICQALATLYEKPERVHDKVNNSALRLLASYFQQIGSKPVIPIFSDQGLPVLRKFLNDYLEGKTNHNFDDNDMLFLGKIFAIYGKKEDVTLLKNMTYSKICPDGYQWSVIFDACKNNPDFASRIIREFRNPLPHGFKAIAFLDLVNSIAIEGKLRDHPFKSVEGIKLLKGWLTDKNEGSFSYAHSATAAIPFISKGDQPDLIALAVNHPDITVQLQAAWANVKIGNQAGVDFLVQNCHDIHQSSRAVKYLVDLKLENKVPAASRKPEFVALSKMSSWLQHPNELGKIPESIEIVDTRELFWPPSNEKRQLYLIKFTYRFEESMPKVSYGMVGSVTFSLFHEYHEKITPAEIYADHCSWELSLQDDAQHPEEISIEQGMKILKQHNPEFGK